MKAKDYLKQKDIGNWILDSHARWKYDEKLSDVMDDYVKHKKNMKQKLTKKQVKYVAEQLAERLGKFLMNEKKVEEYLDKYGKITEREGYN